MKKLLLIIALIIAGPLSAQQLSIHGGGSMLLGFKDPGPWGGFHIGLELPRDDAISIYGRFTHLFSSKTEWSSYAYATDYSTIPSHLPTMFEIPGYLKMNYNILEGGTRYYLGNGFDYGWAAYGGSSIMLVFNTEKYESRPEEAIYYDSISGQNGTFNDVSQHYTVDDYSVPRGGSIFSLGFGLSGGVKYSSGRAGTFYLDLGLAYMIFAQTSSEDVWGPMYNPLIFNFALGYRRDILW